MGEPICLMRSFSHPSSASRETKEGEPFRALTESISFGRFMSESLAWEKWSSFSHNRYLEEVEQFSKPGSVAQKKAFFEAHYKKRAAMKAAAAAALEQPNATVNSIPEEDMVAMNVAEIGTTINSSIPQEEMAIDGVTETQFMNKTYCGLLRDSFSGEATRDTVSDKQEGNQVLEPTYSSDSLQDAKLERAEEVIREMQHVENVIQVVEQSKPLDVVDNYDELEAGTEEKMLNKVAVKENTALQKNNSTWPINKRQMNTSTKSSSQSRASKIPKPSTKTASSTQLNGGTNFKPKSKSLEVDLINSKKTTPKSVHMSINFACPSNLAVKGSIRMSKECSTTPHNSARASVSGISKLLPSFNCESVDKRNRALLSKSVSGGGKLQALSGDRSKSSTNKSRSPIVSSPFSFRSEERAAKRKEFFRKLEEKNILKTHTVVKSKVPLTRPRSPKFGRKPSLSEANETGFQPPRRPSVNAESSKHTIRKSNQSTTHSVTSQPRRKAHENASPNIQL